MTNSAADPLSFETYIDPATLPYAFCPGCSHGLIVDQINAALVRLQLDPSEVVVVSDIGCAGIADKYFDTHAFHGLHGRSVTYATGIKLANPKMHVIVLIGDGGCGIGGHHLINAARRNVGMTVVVFNNLNFGMTGGQYSVTTPPGGLTTTTPGGHLERPLDIASTVAVNGASFVVRTTAYDPALPELMAQAVANDGFSLLDVWEMCVAYYVPRNELNRQALETNMADLGYATGIVHQADRPEYGAAYRGAHAAERGDVVLAPNALPQAHQGAVDRPVRILIAGAAGQRVRSAGRLLAAGGVLSGLWATQRDDYPITVRSGYSLAEVILSPDPIGYTGVEHPDVALLLAPEGAARVATRMRSMAPSGRVYVMDGVPRPVTPAAVSPLGLPDAARRHARKSLSTVGVALLNEREALFPTDALHDAARHTQRPDIAEINVAAIASVAGAATSHDG